MGNIIIENSEKSISIINDDVVCFCIHEGNKSLYGLMTLQGDEVTASSECTYSYCKYGYWRKTNAYNTIDLVNKSGVIATNVKVFPV